MQCCKCVFPTDPRRFSSEIHLGCGTSMFSTRTTTAPHILATLKAWLLLLPWERGGHGGLYLWFVISVLLCSPVATSSQAKPCWMGVGPKEARAACGLQSRWLSVGNESPLQATAALGMRGSEGRLALQFAHLSTGEGHPEDPGGGHPGVALAWLRQRPPRTKACCRLHLASNPLSLARTSHGTTWAHCTLSSSILSRTCC